MNVKVSWTLVQDERVFKNVSVVSKFHEDVFWINDVVGCFDSIKPRPILFKDFTHTLDIKTSMLPPAFKIRTPS